MADRDRGGGYHPSGTGPAIRPEGSLPHEPLEVVRVRIRILRSSAVVEVWDASTVAPAVNPDALAADSEVGRGLFLVGELAEQWGYYYPAVGGKVVWAQIATPPISALARQMRQASAPEVNAVASASFPA